MSTTIIPPEFGDYVKNVEYRLIPANKLITNINYQRDISPKFVQKVIGNFEKNLAKTVRVSARNGQLYVWDGQHTVEITKEAAGSNAVPIWCEVFHDLSYEEEARLFSLQKKYERALSSYDITNAQIEANISNAVKMEQIVNACGFLLGPKLGDYMIKATSSVERSINMFGEECLANALTLIKDTWNGRKEYLNGPFIKALTRFTHDYDYEPDRFIAQFSTITFSEIKLEAKNVSPINRVNYTKAINKLYNKNNRKSRKKV